MSGVWIAVLNSSGVPYGNGPITTARDWKTVESLDAMGAFSFSMPAADPQAALLANKRHVWAFLAGDDPTQWPQGVISLGYGIIDSIAISPSPSGPTMIDVAGSNLLVELANTTSGDLNLFTDTALVPDLVKTVVTGGGSTTWTPGATINLVPLDPGPLSYIYVSHVDAFQSVTVTLGASKNTTVATLQAQYFNESALPMAWESIDLTDGTATGGKPFAQNGTISWQMPSGWGKATYGSYEMRFYCNDDNLTAVTFDTFHVTVRTPTETALQDIMSLAPAGWTLDTAAGYDATVTPVYLQMTNQSILAALGALAEQTGEHFILSPIGRRVLWIGTDKDACGLHAIAADPGGTVDDSSLYILGFKLIKDSAPLFSRIYPKGGGNGTEQVVLNDATDTAWAWYTLNKTSGYIERDAAITEFGRIDAPTDYPDIVPLDSSKDARKHAGNMLLQRALEDLSRGSYQQYAYELSVVASRHRIYPGQTVYVSYHEWDSGYHAINVEQELWVLDVATSITASGDVLTVGLTVALIDSYPLNDGQRLAQEIRRAFNARLQPLPLTGIISQGGGVPYDIGVRDGKITTVKRQPGIADGTHLIAENDTTYFYATTQNGFITSFSSEAI